MASKPARPHAAPLYSTMYCRGVSMASTGQRPWCAAAAKPFANAPSAGARSRNDQECRGTVSAATRLRATCPGRHIRAAVATSTHRYRSCSTSISSTATSSSTSHTNSAQLPDTFTGHIAAESIPASSYNSRRAAAATDSPGWRHPAGGVHAHQPS